jgi:hypothetical protein
MVAILLFFFRSLTGFVAVFLVRGFAKVRLFGVARLPNLLVRLCHGNEHRIERGQGLIRFHVAATASNHCAAASALKIRSVDREMRWR